MKNIDKIRQMSAEEFVKNVLQRPSCSFCVYNGKTCDMGKDCIRGRIKWLNQEINPMPDIKVGDIIVVLLDKGLINKIVVCLIVMSDKHASDLNGVMYNLEDLNIRTIKRMNNTNERVEIIWRADDD